MFPCTRIPFGVPIFDPQPTVLLPQPLLSQQRNLVFVSAGLQREPRWRTRAAGCSRKCRSRPTASRWLPSKNQMNQPNENQMMNQVLFGCQKRTSPPKANKSARRQSSSRMPMPALNLAFTWPTSNSPPGVHGGPSLFHRNRSA